MSKCSLGNHCAAIDCSLIAGHATIDLMATTSHTARPEATADRYVRLVPAPLAGAKRTSAK
jgi:hypothetical protein